MRISTKWKQNWPRPPITRVVGARDRPRRHAACPDCVAARTGRFILRLSQSLSSRQHLFPRNNGYPLLYAVLLTRPVPSHQPMADRSPGRRKWPRPNQQSARPTAVAPSVAAVRPDRYPQLVPCEGVKTRLCCASLGIARRGFRVRLAQSLSPPGRDTSRLAAPSQPLGNFVRISARGSRTLTPLSSR